MPKITIFAINLSPRLSLAIQSKPPWAKIVPTSAPDFMYGAHWIKIWECEFAGLHTTIMSLFGIVSRAFDETTFKLPIISPLCAQDEVAVVTLIVLPQSSGLLVKTFTLYPLEAI